MGKKKQKVRWTSVEDPSFFHGQDDLDAESVVAVAVATEGFVAAEDAEQHEQHHQQQDENELGGQGQGRDRNQQDTISGPRGPSFAYGGRSGSKFGMSRRYGHNHHGCVAPRFERKAYDAHNANNSGKEIVDMDHLPDGFTKIRSKNLDVLFKRDYYAQRIEMGGKSELDKDDEEAAEEGAVSEMDRDCAVSEMDSTSTPTPAEDVKADDDEEAKEDDTEAKEDDTEAAPSAEDSESKSVIVATAAEDDSGEKVKSNYCPNANAPPFVPSSATTTTSSSSPSPRPNLFLYSPSSNTMIPCEEIIIPNPVLGPEGAVYQGSSNIYLAFPSPGTVQYDQQQYDPFAGAVPPYAAPTPATPAIQFSPVSRENSMYLSSSEGSAEPGSGDSTTPHSPPDLSGYSPADWATDAHGYAATATAAGGAVVGGAMPAGMIVCQSSVDAGQTVPAEQHDEVSDALMMWQESTQPLTAPVDEQMCEQVAPAQSQPIDVPSSVSSINRNNNNTTSNVSRPAGKPYRSFDRYKMAATAGGAGGSLQQASSEVAGPDDEASAVARRVPAKKSERSSPPVRKPQQQQQQQQLAPRKSHNSSVTTNSSNHRNSLTTTTKSSSSSTAAASTAESTEEVRHIPGLFPAETQHSQQQHGAGSTNTNTSSSNKRAQRKKRKKKAAAAAAAAAATAPAATDFALPKTWYYPELQDPSTGGKSNDEDEWTVVTGSSSRRTFPLVSHESEDEEMIEEGMEEAAVVSQEAPEQEKEEPEAALEAEDGASEEQPATAVSEERLDTPPSPPPPEAAATAVDDESAAPIQNPVPEETNTEPQQQQQQQQQQQSLSSPRTKNRRNRRKPAKAAARTTSRSVESSCHSEESGENRRRRGSQPLLNITNNNSNNNHHSVEASSRKDSQAEGKPSSSSNNNTITKASGKKAKKQVAPSEAEADASMHASDADPGESKAKELPAAADGAKAVEKADGDDENEAPRKRDTNNKRKKKRTHESAPPEKTSQLSRPILIQDGLLDMTGVLSSRRVRPASEVLEAARLEEALRRGYVDALVISHIGHGMSAGPLDMGRFGLSKYSPPDRTHEIPEELRTLKEEEEDEGEDEDEDEEEAEVDAAAAEAVAAVAAHCANQANEKKNEHFF